jgi:hypothetical protein
MSLKAVNVRHQLCLLCARSRPTHPPVEGDAQTAKAALVGTNYQHVWACVRPYTVKALRNSCQGLSRVRKQLCTLYCGP